MNRRAILLAFGLASAALGAVISSPAHAGWAVDGNPIAATDSAEVYPIIASDGVGGAFIAWRSYESWYYITRLTGTGDRAPGWAADGLEISGQAYSGEIIPDGVGGAIVSWTENFNYLGQANIAANRVTAEGTIAPGWTPLGVAPSREALRSERPTGIESPRSYGAVLPTVASDGLGGAFVAWIDVNRLYEFIHLTHLNGDGTTGTADPFGTNSYGYWPRICSDNHSGVFVGWGSVRADHVEVAGTFDPLWPAGGLPVTAHTEALNQGICPDGAGGVFAAWTEQRTAADQPVIQHLMDSGTVADGWPTDGVVLSSHSSRPGGYREGPSYFDQHFMSLVPDGTGGALVAWTDTRADSGDIYVQHVLADGSIAPGWSAEGVAAGVATGVQELPVLVGDGAGGAYVVWQDGRRTPDFDIYAQHVLADGSLPLGATTEGVPVCIASGSQYHPQIIEDGTGGAIISWSDYRNGNGDVYATRIGYDVTVGTLLSLARAEAFSDRVHVEWSSSLASGTRGELSRREASGMWAPLATLEADGSGRFVYVDRSVVAGRTYGYRLAVAVDGLVLTPEVEIVVPPTMEFALGPARPNPTQADIAIDFTLPDDRAVRIEIADVQGRIRARRNLDSPEPGRNTVTIARRGELPPGLYWIRLSRGAEAKSVRVAVLK
jgi:hypothetical protein